MDSVEVPEYFICPISLQIMTDPVTVVSGITYDRESIERWLFVDNKRICPVSKEPLPEDCDLTPNHTLRRIIQAWCSCHAANGVDRLPTPRSPVNGAAILELLRDLSDDDILPQLQLESLRKIAALASESETNRRCMVQAGVGGAMIQRIVSCSKKKNQIDQIELALSILHSLRISPEELEPLIDNNYDIVESLTWILLHGSKDNLDIKSTTVLCLKLIMEAANPRLLVFLRLDTFQALVLVIHDRISQQAMKAALHVLLLASAWGRNRTKILEAGGMKEILELELTTPEKRTTELNLGILNQLCTCAEGRAELLHHPAGIAVISKRILRVSPATDEQVMRILSSLCKYSATNEVLQEMLMVGAVAKLCLVLQADCASSVKEKARGILRLHSVAWKNSPCVSAYLLSRFP